MCEVLNDQCHVGGMQLGIAPLVQGDRILSCSRQFVDSGRDGDVAVARAVGVGYGGRQLRRVRGIPYVRPRHTLPNNAIAPIAMELFAATYCRQIIKRLSIMRNSRMVTPLG